ncbi:MAG: hypothetical protein COA79_19505 [Planctomycetota bacterium]|nr:MAG: hypothetical protein COA79_19505 [Planctomycetota bacterium]
MKSSKLSQVLNTFTNQSVTSQVPNDQKHSTPSSFFQIEGRDITVSVANKLTDRIQAYNLLYSVYVEKEFVSPNKSKMWYSLFDAHPDTVTFIAKDNNKVVGAITVVFDSEMGLPAESVYSKEIDQLRKINRKPTEIISLGISKDARGAQNILIKLFNLAYLTAKEIHLASDFIITINPKHAPFYIKKMFFKIIGENKSYDKVGGAPATLLILNFKKVEKVINAIRLKTYNNKTNCRFFIPLLFIEDEKEEVIKMIKNEMSPMTKEEVNYFFEDESKQTYDNSEEHFEYVRNLFNLKTTSINNTMTFDTSEILVNI